MINIKNNNDEIKDKIIEFLKTTTIGEPSTEISKQIGHNRLTISKYLEVLQAQGIVTNQEMAQAKLWKLAEEEKIPSILIVDDEPHVVNLIKLSLNPDKFKVFEAYSGNEGLEIIRNNKIDLVVLDLMMPGMTGFQVCNILKKSPLTSNIHVIILSAKGEIKDKINGIEHGADDYITKPFDPLELEARISLSLKHPATNDSKHPVTKLPTKKNIEEQLHNFMFENKDFHVYSFNLSGLDKFAEKKGYKKVNELLVLFTRLLNNNIQEKECFLGHTISNSFVVIGNVKGLDDEISKEFRKMLPYIDEQSQSLKLDVNKLSNKEILQRNIHATDVLKEINVS
ncbi:response regulator [Candidatus Woesearchaeota archaeon]|nr:response regulator [Candidatus Woesearchaeota archaeon]